MFFAIVYRLILCHVLLCAGFWFVFRFSGWQGLHAIGAGMRHASNDKKQGTKDNGMIL